MSLHALEIPGYEQRSTVGWDPPLGTYFAQVYPNDGDLDDDPVLWIGLRPRQAPSLEALRVALQPYGGISDELAAALTLDCGTAPAAGDIGGR
jgi:hypothetical protein